MLDAAVFAERVPMPKPGDPRVPVTLIDATGQRRVVAIRPK